MTDNQKDERANAMFAADLRGQAWLYCGAAASLALVGAPLCLLTGDLLVEAIGMTVAAALLAGSSWWLRRLLRY